MQEAEDGTFTWFDRAPSPSKIADGPTKGDLSVLNSLGAVPVKHLVVSEKWETRGGVTRTA